MKAKYPALDGIRGVAAIFVCLLHISFWGIGPEWGVDVGRSIVAVDLFFMMSGFVIACSYERRLAEGRMTTWGFILTRLVRLYPMYLLSLLLALVVHFDALKQQSLVDGIFVVIFGTVFLPWKISDSNIFFPLNVVYWSLFFELLVNFLYVFGRRWLLDGVLVFTVIILAGILVVLVRSLGMDLGPYWSVVGLIGGFVRALFGIFVGVLLFRKESSFPVWITGRGSYVLPLVIIILIFAVPPIVQIENRLKLMAVLMVFPWSLLYAIRATGIPTRAVKILEFLGVISYPLYLLHLPCWLLLCRLFPNELKAAGPILGGGGFVLLIVTLAALMERYAERPLRRWLGSLVLAKSDRADRLIPAKEKHSA